MALIMDELEFIYRFEFAAGGNEKVVVRLDKATLEPCSGTNETPPDWTRLDFHQCPHCPITVSERPYCPLAVQLAKLVSLCDRLLSHDTVKLEVISAERTIITQTTAQRAVSSLMGLVFATSGCPHTVFLKPMARFHLPFASEEETLFRASSMYLLAQYFRSKQGLAVDLELTGLKRAYSALHQVNGAMAERLRAIISKDSAVNAVVLLDLLAKVLPYSIAESLEEIRYPFEAYLDDRLMPKGLEAHGLNGSPVCRE